MANGEWESDLGGVDPQINTIREILIDAFEEVEPLAPVLIVREADESGKVAYVSRPMLPVAQILDEKIEPTELDIRTESILDVIDAVSKITKYPKEVIYGPGQKSDLVIARHAAMYLARELVVPQPSYPALGRAFDRDHSSVKHAVGRIQELVTSYDPAGAAKREKVSFIIDHVSKILGDATLQREEIIEVKDIVCLCIQGLVSGPLINLKPDERLYGASLGMDWEQAVQSPRVYQRYGDAALSLVKKLRAQ